MVLLAKIAACALTAFAGTPLWYTRMLEASTRRTAHKPEPPVVPRLATGPIARQLIMLLKELIVSSFEPSSASISDDVEARPISPQWKPIAAFLPDSDSNGMPVP